MPRTAYAKSTDTRAQLIAAALEEASERGLRAASVAGIAARANAAVGSLGYHFGSRNALLREAIEQLVSDLYARQAVADAQAGPGFFERHRAELLAYVQYVRVNPSHIRLTDEIKYVEPELYRSGVDRWVELLRMRLGRSRWSRSEADPRLRCPASDPSSRRQPRDRHRLLLRVLRRRRQQHAQPPGRL